MDKVDLVIEKVCDEVITNINNPSDCEYTVELIKALAELVSARACTL